MSRRVIATTFSLTSVAIATPTLYLVGDSTMAHLDNINGLQGWGEFAPRYFTGLNIVNKAVAGGSVRSFTREGRWNEIQGLLNTGDYVIIEFGHNEAGTPSTRSTASVPGEGEETQTVTLPDGTVEVVYTWPHYVKDMIDGSRSKGTYPIISAQTPNNPFGNNTTISNSPPRFVNYAKNTAAVKGVPYVDHFAATIQLYAKLGQATVNSFYPSDSVHTNADGANKVAYAFISGLKCPAAQKILRDYINAAGNVAGRRC